MRRGEKSGEGPRNGEGLMVGRIALRDEKRGQRSTLSVFVTPRSAKPGIGAWREDPRGRQELEIRVAEAPADGAANAAVTKLLAAALGIPKSSIQIVGGATSRQKRITVPLLADEVKQRFS